MKNFKFNLFALILFAILLTSEKCDDNKQSDPASTSLLKVYPNPARDKLTAEFNLTNDCQVVIKLVNITTGIETILSNELRTQGKQIFETQITSEVPAGSYFLQVNGNDINLTEKVQIER